MGSFEDSNDEYTNSTYSSFESVNELDGYGFYDLNQSRVSSKKLNSLVTNKINVDSSKDKKVVCILEKSSAPVACRYFEAVDVADGMVAGVSMAGFRIVQDHRGEYAEHKFCLSIDDKDYLVWKKFSDFQLLANAMIIFRKCEETNDGTLFRNSLKSWEQVLANRPSWWFSKKKLTMNNLMEETDKLELFMKNLLFEVPDINTLVEFILE